MHKHIIKIHKYNSKDNINNRIEQQYNHFKIMNPFTALKDLSPFHFTSLSFTYHINPSLHFTLLFISTAHFS